MKKKKNTNPEFDFADAFFQEVSEDLQNDNLKAFWKKYGTTVVAFVAICLTIAVSFETIKHWRDVSNQKWSNAFATAQSLYNQGKTNESIELLRQIEHNGNDIYADEASLKIINILLEQNKIEEALYKLEVFVQNADSDALKHIALIKLATYKVDSSTPEEIKSILSPLLDNTVGSVWKLEAKELVALSYLNGKQNDKAIEIYSEILKENNGNDILRARAQNMISVLNSDGDK